MTKVAFSCCFLFLLLSLSAIPLRGFAQTAPPPPTNTPRNATSLPLGPTPDRKAPCSVAPLAGQQVKFWPYYKEKRPPASPNDKYGLNLSIHHDDWEFYISAEPGKMVVRNLHSIQPIWDDGSHVWEDGTQITDILAMFLVEIDGYQWLGVILSRIGMDNNRETKRGYILLSAPDGTAYLDFPCGLIYYFESPGVVANPYGLPSATLLWTPENLPANTPTPVPSQNVWHVTCANLTGPLSVYEQPQSERVKPIGLLYPGARVQRIDPGREIADKHSNGQMLTRVAIYWPAGTTASIAYVAIRDSYLVKKDGDYLTQRPDPACISKGS